MITFESVVTLVGTLVTACLAMLLLHGNTVRREKLQHSSEMLELARKLPCDEANYLQLKNKFAPFYEEIAHPSINGAIFLEQALFGIVVFIGFAWWAVHLLEQNLLWWTLVAAIFALIGLLFLLLAWLETKNRNANVKQLVADMDSFVVSPATPVITRTVLERRPVVQEAPVAAAAVSNFQEKPAPQPVTAAPLKSEVCVESVKKQRVPEDSILKRHFLTMLRNEIAMEMPTQPTDSILRRHYEHWLDSKLQMRINELQS